MILVLVVNDIDERPYIVLAEHHIGCSEYQRCFYQRVLEGCRLKCCADYRPSREPGDSLKTLSHRVFPDAAGLCVRKMNRIRLYDII